MEKNSKILVGFALAYALLFLYFYPPFYGNFDEATYMRSAEFLLQGKLPIMQDQLYSYGFLPFNGTFVPLYPLGASAFLALFAIPFWQSIFVSGLFLHLLGFFIFYKLLKKYGHNTLYSLLYLLFPSFVFYSRTLMSDYFSAVIVLAAFYFFLNESKKHQKISGMLFGISVLVRTTNILLVVPFILFPLIEKRKKAKNLIIGLVPPAILLLIHNLLMYGSIFATAYSAWLQQYPWLFSLESIPLQAIMFAAVLSAVFPLMLESIFFYKGAAKKEIILSTVLFFPLFSAFANSFSFSATDFLFANRYFLPLIPLYLFCMVPLYKRISGRFRLPERKALIAIGILLLALAIFISSAHYSYQKQQLQIKEMLYSSTPEASLIVGSKDVDDHLYLQEAFGDRKYADVFSPSLREQIALHDSYAVLLNFQYKPSVSDMKRKGLDALHELVQECSGEKIDETTQPYNAEIYKLKC